MTGQRSRVVWRLIQVIMLSSVIGWAFRDSVFARAQEQNPPVPSFEPVECPDPISRQAGFECGYLIVPEDHHDPAGKTIRLMVAIAHATGSDPLPDPVIVLAGGPGSAAVGRDASSLLESSIRVRRDIIYLDQRGVGRSEPNLLCSELAFSIFDTGGENNLPLYVDRLQNCRDRLRAEGVNLEAYTTAQSAADVHTLREVLGYEKLNLWGSSYGTRLALVIMRDYPGDVRSAVLDSVFPPNADLYLEAVAIASEAFRAFFNLCDEDPLCHLVYPDLQKNYLELFERLNADPVRIRVTHPKTGDPVLFKLDGDALAAGVLYLLSDQSAVAMLPAFIDEFHDGDFGSFDVLLRGVAGGSATNGMAFSIMCAEETAFVTLDEITAVAQAFPQARQVGISEDVGLQVCQVWLGDVTPDPRENAPVVSNIPTLLLSGELDPSTPPSWARLAAETLDNRYVYKFPGVGHIALGGSSCPQSIMLDFLDDPAQTPDSGCIAQMKDIAFVVTTHATRPWSRIIAVVFGLLAASGFGIASYGMVRHPRQLAWITSLRLMGWLPLVFSVGGLALLLLFGNLSDTDKLRLVETVIPLAIALNMTFLFSPADDPSLELLLTCPRRPFWILLERLVIVLLTQGAIAIAAALLTLVMTGDDDILLALTRWIPPALMLSGIALYATIRSRVAVFGAGLTLLIWFGLVMLGDMLLPGRLLQFPLNYIQPWLWPFQPYLQPDSLTASDYLINRIVVSAAGVNLIALVVRQLRDEETILFGVFHKTRRGII